MKDSQRRPSRSLLVLLLLACATLITLDYRGGEDSPLEPVRAAIGNVVGPVEEATATAVRPFREIPGFFRTNKGLRNDLAELEAENSNLRSEIATTSLERARAEQLDGLLDASRSTGYALVAARVIGLGPAQSFSRTVTIDKGRSSGIFPDMTVLNHDGLVGRVLRSDTGTATVLLIVDEGSVVGGRLGSSSEVGFLRGRGDLGDDGRLDLELVDNSAMPGKNDVVTTWGSKTSAPYVPGIPIGVVESVYSSPRQLSKQAVIRPLVDFSSLDVVGIVVNDDTEGAVIKAGELP
ncbi:MAG TPA: rod shape-determining protein MreC [Nocardioidaceae bacterium]|nr:rod shape-determining protein MreC [Nocardioidaceae bacterium]